MMSTTYWGMDQEEKKQCNLCAIWEIMIHPMTSSSTRGEKAVSQLRDLGKVIWEFVALFHTFP